MEMDTQYFIDKFEAIPEEKWGMHAFQNTDGTRCALGHCLAEMLPINSKVTGCVSTNSCATTLQSLFYKYLYSAHVTDINDGVDPRYIQDTPKQRILAALRDIKVKEDEERIVQMVNDMLEIPICPDCGKPVTLCDCEEGDLEEDEEEDWGAGEALKDKLLEPSF